MGLQQGKKIVNRRNLKKAGIIAASVSATAIVVIMLLAIFKGGSNGGFTIRIDNPSVDNHVTMSTSSDGSNNSTLLSGEPVDKMYPSTAQDVESYLSSFTVNDIGGPKNMKDKNEARQAEGYFSAVVYTVFLTNYSDTEDQKLDYEVHLHNYVAPENGAINTLDYMRVMIQTSTSATDIAGGRETRYFAMHNGSTLPDYDERDRECISSYSVQLNEQTNKSYRKPEYVGLSKDGYCENFLMDENNDVIISEQLLIKPKETMRFTFASYLEGKDPDCKSYAPDSAVLLMSLHFGKKI